MAKKRLYLHIGRHKTGTSSLQQFFAQNPLGLALNGVIYPNVGRYSEQGHLRTGHHWFCRTLHTRPKEEILKMFREMDKEAEGYRAILLSSEDFQNLMDFDLLAEVFEPYKVTVICYLREGLNYGLSSFAQRIHSSSDVFSIKQFIAQQRVPLLKFMQNWTEFADRSVFRLYERSLLKDQDIITDFFDAIGLDDIEEGNREFDSNPSISGNLLSLKMLLNMMGQNGLTTYAKFSEAALLDPTFQGKIYVDDHSAAMLRDLTDYNAILRAKFPNLIEPSFEGGHRLFDFSRWDEDMEKISKTRGMDFVRGLRLGIIHDLLEKHGLEGDPIANQFPSETHIRALRMPKTVVTNQMRDRAIQALRDLNVVTKEKAVAQQTAAAAQLRIQELNKELKLTRTTLNGLEHAKKGLSGLGKSTGISKPKVKAKVATLQAALQTSKQENIALTADHAKQVKDLQAQVATSAGQVYYFRGENFRTKKKLKQALEMFEKAVEFDPDNADYKARVEKLKSKLS